MAEKSSCSCRNSSDDSSIRHKIQTANVLIKRVKEALHSIKMRKHESKENATSECATDIERDPTTFDREDKDTSLIKMVPILSASSSQSVSELDRPKTRRQVMNDEQYIAEKYRTEPKDLECDSELDVLKSKLNAISESTESEDSKVLRHKEKSTCTDTGK